MTVSEYTFREYRPRTVMVSKIPLFRNTFTTVIPKYMHHVSMYAIDEEEANNQIRIGNTKYREVPHYSAELVIDCDDHESAEKTWDKLVKLDYNFETWKLNNFKFFIKRDTQDKPSTKMCFQDKQFVRDNFFQPKIDLGIYCSPFHLIRARGSIHEVTKAKSELVGQYCGSNSVSTNHIDNYYQPAKNYDFDPNYSDWQNLQFVINNANAQGANKHIIVWKLAMSIAKMCSFETGLELCLIYARALDYEEKKAIRAIEQAYSQNQNDSKWEIMKSA